MSRVGQRNIGPELYLQCESNRLGFRHMLENGKFPVSQDLLFYKLDGKK